MAAACLLDTTVIIDVLNGRCDRGRVLEALIAEGTMLACCPINVAEVYMGMRPNEAEKTDAFLASLEFYPVTREIARLAGGLYREWREKGLTLALPDLTIAAVAIANRLQLATDNPKDFPMPELRFCRLG